MQYSNVVPGRFVSRPNRFLAQVETADGVQTCHVKNTGRCAELLLPGAPVWLQRFGADAKRKTKFDLIAVQKGALLLNIDSQAPNAAAREFLASGGLGWIPSVLRPEYTWGDSRFDFYLEHGGRRCLAEVKGVTLEEDGTALFPDAPTLRGIKHLEGLSRAAAQGFACCVLFVVQFSPAAAFAPNRRTHPAFADALRAARDAGVRVLAYDCAVTPESMVLRAPRRRALRAACCSSFNFLPQPPSRPTGARTLLSQTPCAPHGTQEYAYWPTTAPSHRSPWSCARPSPSQGFEKRAAQQRPPRPCIRTAKAPSPKAVRPPGAGLLFILYPALCTIFRAQTVFCMV